MGKLRVLILVCALLIMAVVNSSGVSSVWADYTHSERNDSSRVTVQSPRAAENLLRPLFNPEGRCASDIPGLTVFYEDTEKYSEEESFPGFTDVSTHDTYCLPIRQLVVLGAINGYADGTFRPHNVVTRGQFAKMIVETFRYPHVLRIPATFADVPLSSHFYPYVETAEYRGLVTGVQGNSSFYNICIQRPDGGYGAFEDATKRYFRPCLNITRGQMAKPLAAAAGYGTVPGRATFVDVNSSYHHYQFIERLAWNISLDEIPLNMPSRPICYGVTKPCYFPEEDVRRHDAATLLYRARQGTSREGRAFPRRLRVASDGRGGFDGVQGFISTPSNDPPGGLWIAAPLAIASVPNFHFVESGPYRKCSSTTYSDDPLAPDVCLNHPYASSATIRWCGDVPCEDAWDIVEAVILASDNSYEYRSFYIPGYNEWWSEFYHPNLAEWQRIITVTQLGTNTLHEVSGAAETSGNFFPSGTIRYTNVRAHFSGEPPNTWHGWCPDRTVYNRLLFNSDYSSCPPPGAEPFSWDVWFTP